MKKFMISAVLIAVVFCFSTINSEAKPQTTIVRCDDLGTGWAITSGFDVSGYVYRSKGHWNSRLQRIDHVRVWCKEEGQCMYVGTDGYLYVEIPANTSFVIKQESERLPPPSGNDQTDAKIEE